MDSGEFSNDNHERERESGRARIKIFKGCVAITVEPEVIAAGVHKGGVKHTGS